MEFISRLKPAHWAWLHFKFVLIIWAILFVAFTPPSPSAILGVILEVLIGLFVLTGVFISITGLIRSMSYDFKTAYSGAKMELAGSFIAITGPISYMIVQFNLSTIEEGNHRFALTAFAYALVSTMVARIFMIIGHLRELRGE